MHSSNESSKIRTSGYVPLQNHIKIHKIDRINYELCNFPQVKYFPFSVGNFANSFFLIVWRILFKSTLFYAISVKVWEHWTILMVTWALTHHLETMSIVELSVFLYQEVAKGLLRIMLNVYNETFYNLCCSVEQSPNFPLALIAKHNLQCK